MSDLCKCCYECSPRSQGCHRQSFPKKLLVATSVVIVLAMCVTAVESRTTTQHRIRHEKSQAQPTKEMALELNKRPHRRTTSSTKDSPESMRTHQRNAIVNRFKNATKKIISKLKNTRRYFNEERRVLNETKDYRDGMPLWLPSINFVNIHFFDYRNTRRSGLTITERKFAYLMPKLYKSLMEFKEIFELLLQVEVNFPDDLFFEYNRTRHELIIKTLEHLNGTTEEIRENMIYVNLPVPRITPSSTLNELDLKVHAPACLKNDHIAFRAYGNLLKNWYLEFRCPTGKKVISMNRKCAEYEATLAQKKASRSSKSRQPQS